MCWVPVSGAFFRAQRGRKLASSSLSLNNHWQWPPWVMMLFLMTNLRSRIVYVEFKLRTIHPNPGPRDKTDVGKEKRRQRRYEKRIKVREARRKKSLKKELRIVTWNVQRMSMGTYNMVKAKQVIKIAVREDWDMVLLSELRAENSGVKWFGSVEDNNLVVIIYSQKAGILIRKELLTLWTDGGMQKFQDERCVSVRIQGVVYTATYQPVYHHNNMEDIYQAKMELKQHVGWSSSHEIAVIGGDFNAHIGNDGEKPGVCGKFGLRSSNQQGLDLVQFCEENNLAYCNSFYNFNNRGTWFNNFYSKWYELDGFLMRSKQRHKNIKKMSTVNEISLSDHKPKLMIFKHLHKKFGINKKKARVPKIDADKLKSESVAVTFRQKVSDLMKVKITEDLDEGSENLEIEDFLFDFWNLIGEDLEVEDFFTDFWNLVEEVNVTFVEFNDNNRWKVIADTVVKAATEACGVKEKHIESPWMIGKDEIIVKMRQRITDAVGRRNTIMENLNTGDEYSEEILEECRTELKEARKDLKRSTRQWEKEYWEEILNDCEKAGERGDQGHVYKLLKTLGKRDFKSAPVNTNLTSGEFRDHFKKVSETRFERDPEDIDKFVAEIPDMSKTDKALEWRDLLDEVPTKKEIHKQVLKMKNSAPGDDEVKLCYLLEAGPKIFDEVVNLIQYMFENDSIHWERSLKVGNVIPLFKKGDKDNPGNYRGICLLSMGSRILARVLADRLRLWSEDMDLLDDDQAGFRKERSTADGTQIMLRIEEDTVDLRARMIANGDTIDEKKMPAGRLLD